MAWSPRSLNGLEGVGRLSYRGIKPPERGYWKRLEILGRMDSKLRNFLKWQSIGFVCSCVIVC